MKALTIHAYWAWAIMAGIKRVENRSWRTRYRGLLTIHVGQSRASDAEARATLESLGVELPPDDQIVRGAVLGVVDLVDVISKAERRLFSNQRSAISILKGPLATGPECWILEKPRPLDEPIPWAGKQGLWGIDLADSLLCGGHVHV
jgi:hypothetical protein